METIEIHKKSIIVKNDADNSYDEIKVYKLPKGIRYEHDFHGESEKDLEKYLLDLSDIDQANLLVDTLYDNENDDTECFYDLETGEFEENITYIKEVIKENHEQRNN